MYAIMYGFYSDNENADYDSFWSTKDKAMNQIIEYAKIRNLEQQRSRKTNELVEVWSDGDYYCFLTKIEVDQEY